MHVLVCEDDHRLARGMRRALERAGHRVVRAADVAEANQLIDERFPDIALVDMTLPDGNGIDVVRRLRSNAGTAIIIVTAHGEEHERVLGLRSGADDYIVKPFAVAELLARMDAIDRRIRHARQPAVVPNLTHGELELDTQQRLVRLTDAQEITLTAKETELLALLIEHAGVVLERDYVLNKVWAASSSDPSRSLDTHIGSLRSKLGDTVTIQTVRGVGYLLVQDTSCAAE